MENIPALKKCFDKLIEKKYHIAFAESCTGGLCAKALTDIAGASEIIEGSLVSYSNRIKTEKLGVRAETIEKYTEVSAECAVEMARGIRIFADSDIGASLTGYAGPAGENVGLVYIAVVTNDNEVVKELHLSGDREDIRLAAASECFEEIYKALI